MPYFPLLLQEQRSSVSKGKTELKEAKPFAACFSDVTEFLVLHSTL